MFISYEFSSGGNSDVIISSVQFSSNSVSAVKSVTMLNFKGVIHFKRKKKLLLIIYPHVIQDVHVFLSLVEKKLRFLMKTFQDFFPYNGLQWGPNGSRSK